MELVGDNAGCCGIIHLRGVGATTAHRIAERKLASIRQYVTSEGNASRLITMSLADYQLSHPAMKEVFLPGIKEMGWQLVTRFRNPFSGNIVNVFHYTSELRTTSIPNTDIFPCNQGKDSD